MESVNQTSVGGYELPLSTFPAPLFPVTRWILFSCIIAWAVYNCVIYPRCINPFRSLPQPKGGFPLIGHALIRLEQPLGQGYLRLMNEVANDGIILLRDLFDTNHLLITSPDAIADILVRKPYDFEKPPELRGFIRRVLGDGLLTSEGETHKLHRRIVTPNFTLRQTSRLTPTFWGKGRELVERISAQIRVQTRMGSMERKGPPTGVIDMNHWATRLTMDIFGLAGLGLDLQTMHTFHQPIEDSYKAAFEPTMQKYFVYGAIWCGLGGLIDSIPWKVDRQLTGPMDYVRSFLRESIQKRRHGHQPAPHDVPDMLSKLLESGSFSDDELVEQFLTFFAAGHETIAGTIAWAIYALAASPSIQARLREELHAHITPETDPTTLAGLFETLPTLNGFCNETIRLYPSVPVTPRVASCDTSIGDVAVPRGTRIMLVPRAINRARHLWGERAEEFVPERWFDPQTGELNRTGGAGSKYAGLTFLHGPHGCIGSGFAKAELRAVVAAVVGSLEVELVGDKEDIMPRGRFATRPGDVKDQLMVRVRLLE